MDLQVLHWMESAATAPAQFFLASLWQGALLAGAAWVGMEGWTAITRRLAPRPASGIAPRTRFLLWMIVLVFSVVVPLSTFVPALLETHFVGVPTVAIPASAGLAVPRLSAFWAAAILAAWGLTSLFCLARLVVNGWRLHRLARNTTPFPADAAAELRARLVAAGSRRAELRISARVDAPIAIGFFHPAIVIPDWLAKRLTPAELHQIVMHELAHLQRGDDWTNLLQKFLCALFPLNPALLWVERRLCREREMACDDAVLATAIAPRDYAVCLTSLAEKRLLRNQHALAPGAWHRRSELTDRVHRILKHRGAVPPLRSRPLIAAFAVIYVSAGLALARCPRLVRFVPVAEFAPLSAAARTAPNVPEPPSGAHLVRASLQAPAPIAEGGSLSGAAERNGASRKTVQTATRRETHGNAFQPSFRSVAWAGEPAGAYQPAVARRDSSRPGLVTDLIAHSRGAQRSQPRLFNARYVQKSTAAGKQPPRLQIVFTLWEFTPVVGSGLPDAPLPAPSYVALSQSTGWIVFQL